MPHWLSREGSAEPLGVTPCAADESYNFALYSQHATAVSLELYGVNDPQTPLHCEVLDPAINKTSFTWHCRLPAALVQRASYYAYRVDGPNDPSSGHRFDAEKVLLDPYARSVYFPPGHSRKAAAEAGDNAGQAPLGRLPAAAPEAFDWGDEQRPRHGHDAIIYETHLRGFTQSQSSGLGAEKRGTFAGLIAKIPYLKELGVTIVELLPVYQFDPQEANYWGYMTLNFFSPHHLYAVTPENAINEFKTLVRALHEADIEVILDVVYNHTTEEDQAGPNYSFRGIDNRTWYLLEQDRSRYHNDAGCGNVLHTAHRQVRTYVLDSLRYWVEEMHVDGFRFDLASIFTRRSDRSIDLEDPPIIAAIRNDPVLSQVRLIAEAWDITSYQLGRAFPGINWLQWNGKFRDDIRRFVKGETALSSAVATRIYGSDDLFPDNLEHACHAYQSVNFITAHDGFCLYDLVSYDHKHNEGSDGGSDDNHSWNCGFEGDTGAPNKVLDLRQQQLKNFFALLLLSNGTPMFVAGDEFANTQKGNNNPYNLDSEVTWLDWSRLQQYQGLFRFVKTLIAFRKAHKTLGRSRHWRKDVTWYGAEGEADWSYHSRSLAWYLDGASEDDVDLYVMANAWWKPLEFSIQEGEAGQWQRVLDTSKSSPEDILTEGQEAYLKQSVYPVAPRSIVLLMRKRQ